jgi:hypothetical protein
MVLELMKRKESATPRGNRQGNRLLHVTQLHERRWSSIPLSAPTSFPQRRSSKTCETCGFGSLRKADTRPSAGFPIYKDVGSSSRRGFILHLLH